MSDFIFKLQEILPTKQYIKLRNEVDFYGISHMISTSLNLPFTPRGFSDWHHGWFHEDLKYIEQFELSSKFKHLVLTDEQQRFLEENGRCAVAVGAPYIYAEEFDQADVYREPNSLLVMPPHGLWFTNETWDEEAYVKQICSLKSDFDQIVACLHSSCLDKNKWSEKFEENNIPWIVGADMRDKYALVRMHRIFSSFEYMTTNAIGSHIAYAAYSGCKVSIFGHYAEWKQEYVKDDPTYLKYPNVMHNYLEGSSRETVAKNFPFLFVHPKKASKHIEWAKEELGSKNKKSYFELAKLIGWLPHQQVYFWSLKILSKLKKEISSFRK